MGSTLLSEICPECFTAKTSKDASNGRLLMGRSLEGSYPLSASNLPYIDTDIWGCSLAKNIKDLFVVFNCQSDSHLRARPCICFILVAAYWENGNEIGNRLDRNFLVEQTVLRRGYSKSARETG